MKGRSFPFKGIIAYPPPVSRPDLLFFGFCFLFVSSRRRRESIFLILCYILCMFMLFCILLCAPLSVPAQSAGTPPPQGEASVPASIAAKFVVRQSRRNVYLTTKHLSIYGRALGSPCGGAGAKRLRGATKKRPLARAPARLYIFCKKENYLSSSGSAVSGAGASSASSASASASAWAALSMASAWALPAATPAS